MIEEFEPPLHEPVRDAGWLRPLLIAAVIGVVVLGGGAWFWQTHRPPPVPEAPETLPLPDADAQAYLQQVDITGPDLSRWQNFLGQTVTYVEITVINHGPRTIRALELTFYFMARDGDVAKKESVRVLGNPNAARGSPSHLPLGPDSSVSLTLGFEDISDNWDQTPPRLVITGVLLGEPATAPAPAGR